MGKVEGIPAAEGWRENPGLKERAEREGRAAASARRRPNLGQT